MKQTAASMLGLCAVAIWLILTIPTVADAHAVGAEARLKNGKVMIEAFYDDDTPVADAKVVITNPDGKLTAEGKTDKEGKCSFEAPLPGKYKVIVDAGAGHRATVGLTIPITVPPQTSESGSVANSTGTVLSPTNDEVIVSEGPTRSEFTGWRRLAWAVAGVVILGGGSWALTRLFQAVTDRKPKADQADCKHPDASLP